MKTISILGIIFFSIFILAYFSTDSPADGSEFENAFYCGFLGVLYGLASAIVVLVYCSKNSNLGSVDIVTELAKLGELKEKGILTEEEFTNRKNKLLNNGSR